MNIYLVNFWPLFGLLLIPLIWLLSKLIPNVPKRQIFPAIVFLFGLQSENRTAQIAPLWLKIMRAIGLCCLAFAFANPIFTNAKNERETGRATLIIIDDSYSAAPYFAQTKETLRKLLAGFANSANANKQFYIITTSMPKNKTVSPIGILAARNLINDIEPKPLFFDHSAAAELVKKISTKVKIFYFSDGLEHPTNSNLLKALLDKSHQKIDISIPNGAISAISEVIPTKAGFDFKYITSDPNSSIIAEIVGQNGQILASGTGKNGLDKNGQGKIVIAPNLARQAAIMRISGQSSTGAVYLLDGYNSRRLIGIEASRETDQPLLSDANYLNAAAAQIGENFAAPIAQLIASKPSVIIIGDTIGFDENDSQDLNKFIENGGILIRFAGPKTIGKTIDNSHDNSDENFVTAPLSPEARVLEGALSLTPPQIADFKPQSPFYGLEIDKSATPKIIASFAEVDGQATSNQIQIWAQMNDGTPLVSARKIGAGELVMFHTTASPIWSDLAYSGQQVAMLRRIISRANGQKAPPNLARDIGPLRPSLLLDGYGRTSDSNAASLPFFLQSSDPISPSVTTPPGIYESQSARFIIQGLAKDTKFKRLGPLSQEFRRFEGDRNNQFSLQPILLILFILIIFIDGLFISGIFCAMVNLTKKTLQERNIFGKIIGSAAIAICAFLVISPQDARAQEGGIRLGYIITNDNQTNQNAKAGLEGLGQALVARTSVRVAGVVGLNPDRDELALYPIIYWLVPTNNALLSPAARNALNNYMNNGGLLFIDTQNSNLAPSQRQAITRAALSGLVIPPLEQVPTDHVLTKSFYILSSFRGQLNNAKLWIENHQSTIAGANDGVTPILLGDGNWARAWAINQNEINNAREPAIRVGINIYIYALTGQYKADQVHVRTLLERLSRAPKQ